MNCYKGSYLWCWMLGESIRARFRWYGLQYIWLVIIVYMALKFNLNMTIGTGEHIIRINLAQRLGEALRVASQSDEGEDPHDILNRILVDDFGGKEEALSYPYH